MLKNLITLFSVTPLLCLYFGLFLLYGESLGGAKLDFKLTMTVLGINLGFFPIFTLFLARKLGLISDFTPKFYSKDSVIIYLIVSLFLFWTYYVCRHGISLPETSLFPRLILAVLVANCLSLVLSRLVVLDMRISCVIIAEFCLIINWFKRGNWDNYLCLALSLLAIVGYFHQNWRNWALKLKISLVIAGFSWLFAMLLTLLFNL